MQPWEPVLTADGSWTLRHPVHAQTCHSLAGAWQESRERYAAACRLRERARPGGVLRLLDIGTGLGLNLAAALEALAGTGATLEAWTLESEREVFASLARLPAGPPEVELWHAPLKRALVEAALAPASLPLRLELVGLPRTCAGAEVQLVLDDARISLPALPPSLRFDAVFLDAFSPRVEGDLWSPEFLRQVALRMTDEALLSTYSVALPVRRALHAAGLRVGKGAAVGTKSAGTLASRSAILPPLDARQSRRVARVPGVPGAGFAPPGRELEPPMP
jgi:tRNA U34 5-methylaminomethyl-2-thiouridine-forming methyltransferase MnmC